MKNFFTSGESRMLHFAEVPKGNFLVDRLDPEEHPMLELTQDGALQEKEIPEKEADEIDPTNTEEQLEKRAEEDVAGLQNEVEKPIETGSKGNGKKGNRIQANPKNKNVDGPNTNKQGDDNNVNKPSNKQRNKNIANPVNAPSNTNNTNPVNAPRTTTSTGVNPEFRNIGNPTTTNNNDNRSQIIINGPQKERISEYNDKALLSALWKGYMSDLDEYLKLQPTLQDARIKQGDLIARMKDVLSKAESRYDVSMLPGSDVPILYNKEAYSTSSVSLAGIPQPAIDNINTLFAKANRKFTPGLVATLNARAAYFKLPIMWRAGPDGCPPMPYPVM